MKATAIPKLVPKLADLVPYLAGTVLESYGN